MNLTGNFHVRALRAAFHEAHRLLPRAKDRAQLRRHSLKLRYFGVAGATDDAGLVIDLDFEWVKALAGLHVGELRIHDRIADCDNLRVIFFNPKIPSDPLPMLWVLAVMQKKSNDFTKAQLVNLKARRTQVLERFYDG